jgi:DNA-3-methyladenine glycosylase II
LNGRQFDPLLDYQVQGEYRRVAEMGGAPVLYGVSEALHRGRPQLQIRVLLGPANERTMGELRRLVQRQFSTDLDLSPFYRLVREDVALSRLVAHFRGMRIPQSTNIFETLVSAILEQQVNLTFAYQVKKALIETYGDSMEHEGRKYNIFPEPAALAISTPRQLRRLQISGPKARYVIGLARAVLDGSLDLEGLRGLDPASADAKLRGYKGIGPWTAQYVGLRALGHLDSLPAADVGLQKALQRLYGLRKLPSPVRVTQISRAWAGWRSYVTFYLWLTYWEDREWNERLAQEIQQAKGRGKP